MAEYVCQRDAAVTRELESAEPEVVRVIAPGERVAALEVRATSNGQRRARTADGWVSLVAGSGVILLVSEVTGTPVQPDGALVPSPSQYDDDDERERVKASQLQAMLLAAPPSTAGHALEGKITGLTQS